MDTGNSVLKNTLHGHLSQYTSCCDTNFQPVSLEQIVCEPSTLLMKIIYKVILDDLPKNKAFLPLRIFSFKSDLGSKGNFRIKVLEINVFSIGSLIRMR